MTVSVPAAEAGGAARDRRVDPAASGVLLQARGVAAAGLDRDGGEIYYELRRAQRLGQTAFRKDGFFHRLIRRQVEKNHVDAAHRVRG